MHMPNSPAEERDALTLPDREGGTKLFPFANTYTQLPADFFARVAPTPVRAPRLVKLNVLLASRLGLDPAALASDAGIQILAGNRLATGSEPIATAYAGHQFGNLVPQLGDGRAHLLGEINAPDGQRYDIQLKGSGPTPFSRRGDGRAALGPVLREYLVSEAMAALGVPTTRALAAVATGEEVFREQILPGAVLTRVAASHLRIGTFQYFAVRGQVESIRVLANYAMARHYREALASPKPYRAFLDGVVERQATLVAQWMLLGFIHGVMNTDNTSISGETIDYGPCAFLEAYEPNKTFSAIDRLGRYAYGNQPDAMHWNLTRLAEALLPLLATEAGSDESGLASAYEALSSFETHYEKAYTAGFRRKLGLENVEAEDLALCADLREMMAANQADFTLTFRLLCEAVDQPAKSHAARKLFADVASYDSWAARWLSRLQQEAVATADRSAAMRSANPIYIPRNHLVEAALSAAKNDMNFAPFEELLDAVCHPYDDNPRWAQFARPATPQSASRILFAAPSVSVLAKRQVSTRPRPTAISSNSDGTSPEC